jgi:hypothetical protein
MQVFKYSKRVWHLKSKLSLVDQNNGWLLLVNYDNDINLFITLRLYFNFIFVIINH